MESFGTFLTVWAAQWQCSLLNGGIPYASNEGSGMPFCMLGIQSLGTKNRI